MNIVIDYGDKKTEYSHVRYGICKALEEVIDEMQYGSCIEKREITIDDDI